MQTLFLDFDGAVVDTTKFQLFGATPGVRTLSPLSAFLPQWGLSAADLPALERVITATVVDILIHDVVAHGPNPHAALRVLTSARGTEVGGVGSIVWYRLTGRDTDRWLPSTDALIAALAAVGVELADLVEVAQAA